MTVEALKEEIAHLSEPERKHLVDWLEEMEDQAWDSEMTSDFSVGGSAAYLLAEVQADIAASRTRPLSETDVVAPKNPDSRYESLDRA